MLPAFTYVQSKSVADAVTRLAAPGARVHAGGTDLLGCLRDGVFKADRLVSIAHIAALKGMSAAAAGGLRIGALTTIADIAADKQIAEKYPALAQAASVVASPQLRNQGTIGGNLCQRPRCWYFRGDFPCARKSGDLCYAVAGENQYHAIFGGDLCFMVHPSDTAPALVALGAQVRLTGPAGVRTVPLASFFVRPDAKGVTKETVLQRGEILTDVLLPPLPAGTKSSYRKVRSRGAWDFALASVALVLTLDAGVVKRARVVLGGAAPIPWRSEAVEKVLTGAKLTPEVAAKAGEAAVQGAKPLTNNEYKVTLFRGVVEEQVLALI
jgi:xanthine dehydrogenase YagS FAD-binding subunit